MLITVRHVGDQVDSFRKFFTSAAPFSVEGTELKLEHVAPAYSILDEFHHGKVQYNCADPDSSVLPT